MNLAGAKHAGMKKHIIHIFALLLSATAVLSCMAMDADILDNPGTSDKPVPGRYALTISGTASDIDTSLPIEEIRITVSATERRSPNSTVTHEIAAYTDNNGKFSINMGGFRYPISCTVTAEDPNGRYAPNTHEIPQINWDSSYSMIDNVFYVNDCNFYLKKAE